VTFGIPRVERWCGADFAATSNLPHHLRFAQSPALGRKVSDEFTVPLCRGHHREVHRCGDEAAWWGKAGINPTVAARALWANTSTADKFG
jgi:hypothetical protein